MTDAHDTALEYEVADVRLVARFLAARPADALPSVVQRGPARVARHRYLDTALRHLLRAGFVVRVQRRRRKALAEILPLRDGHDGAPGYAEELESDDPAGLRRARGPVGRRVHLLAGRAPLRELLTLKTREI